MNKQTLSAAITRSGWKGAWEGQIDGLLSKLEFLANKKRYSRLMANIETANIELEIKISARKICLKKSRFARISADFYIIGAEKTVQKTKWRWRQS
jgi:hypothetical protein